MNRRDDAPPPTLLERYRAWQRDHGLLEMWNPPMLSGLGMMFYVGVWLVGITVFLGFVLPVLLAIIVPLVHWWWSIWVPRP
jgi:hypothetical protein